MFPSSSGLRVRAQQEAVTVAMVNNPDMIELKKPCR
jgi:hypothetical protein